MTNEEARLNLEKLSHLYDEGIIDFSIIRESIKVAIEALKCMSLNADMINADAMHKLFITGEMTMEDFKKTCGKEISASDLISRQAAITLPVMPKEHREYRTFNLDDAYEQGWNDLQKCIESLPSAQPNMQPICNQLATDLQFLQPESEYVFYDSDHGFCINTQDVLDCLRKELRNG